MSTVVAVQLAGPDLLGQQAPRSSATSIAQDSQRSGLTPDQPAAVTTPFQPLNADIVNEAIPAFFVGRNKEGFWLARDVKGRIGGVFLFESSALSFARRHYWPSGCATIFLSERLELDLQNQGNPLIAYLRPLMHLAMHVRQRIAALTGKTTAAIERRFRDFHAP
jgi:hypothetical protein